MFLIQKFGIKIFDTEVRRFGINIRIINIKKPLDSSFIAVVKSKYRRWINLKIYAEGIPNKFSKITRIVEIAHEVPLKVGKRCWRVSLFPEDEIPEMPQEVLEAQEEIESEEIQKLVEGYDQMYIGDEILDEYPTDDRVIELVPIPDPDCEIIAEKPKEKRQIQQTMTKFLTAKQKK